MKNWIYFLIALILCMIIHEGIHAIVALLYGEYHSIVIHWYGPQVLFVTPVAERISDIRWFSISGVSNFATLFDGCILMINRELIVKYISFFGVSSNNILFMSWYGK